MGVKTGYAKRGRPKTNKGDRPLLLGTTVSGLPTDGSTIHVRYKSRHFLLPLQDDFLEVVAWNVRLS